MENLENAVQDETVKIKTHYARISVGGIADKPYYSIEWFDPAKQELCLGYGSYNIENVFNWLSERFEIVEAPKTNADRVRTMGDAELANFMVERSVNEYTLLRLTVNHGLTAIQIEALKSHIYCALLRWLRQPVAEEQAWP